MEVILMRMDTPDNPNVKHAWVFKDANNTLEHLLTAKGVAVDSRAAKIFYFFEYAKEHAE